ncbi:MAG: tyrosine-type recombinase/integrase [Ktedonobacterales bacterium]|nr:tyrosine-type recombinase/integrase [Ktedonobacterales bacterium]
MAKRRGNNTGTVTQREDGRWMARITLPSGKRKSIYGKTRKDTQKKLREVLNDLDQGLLPADGRQTVEQYLTSWLETVKHEIEPSSHLRYTYHMQRVKKEFGTLPLSKLNSQRIQQFYSRLLEEGLAQTTVNTMHRVFKHALTDAVRLRLIPRNQAELVKPPRYEPAPKQVLSEAQVLKLLDAVKGDSLEALYPLVLSTGMREGELFALQWEDIDFDKGILHVRHNMQDIGPGYRMAKPKSRSSRRTITLAPLALQALREHRQRQKIERESLGDVWDKTYDFIFPNQFGRHKIPTWFISDEFPRLLKKAGLPIIHFHDLRHTAATLLLSNGVHLKVASEMLGYSDVSITLRIYGHVLPNMQQNAADVANRLIGGQDMDPQ